MTAVIDECKGIGKDKLEAVLVIMETVMTLDNLRLEVVKEKRLYEQLKGRPVTGDCDACGHTLGERGLERAREQAVHSLVHQNNLVNELIVQYRTVERDLQVLEEEFGGKGSIMEPNGKTLDLSKLERLLDLPQDFFLRILGKKRTASATANSESGQFN
jgi:hypothetical protein